MLKIYGSMMCPDCVRCREDLDRACVKYEYLDFADSLKNLKAFLDIREHNGCFAEVRAAGKIGIPCIVDDHGKISFSWEEYM